MAPGGDYARFRCNRPYMACERCARSIPLGEMMQGKIPSGEEGWRDKRCFPTCAEARRTASQRTEPPSKTFLKSLLSPKTVTFCSQFEGTTCSKCGNYIEVGNKITAEVCSLEYPRWKNMRCHPPCSAAKTSSAVVANQGFACARCKKMLVDGMAYSLDGMETMCGSCCIEALKARPSTPRKRERSSGRECNLPSDLVKKQRTRDVAAAAAAPAPAPAPRRAGVTANLGASSVVASSARVNPLPPNATANTTTGDGDKHGDKQDDPGDGDTVECIGEVSVEEQIAQRQARAVVCNLAAEEEDFKDALKSPAPSLVV